MFLRHLYACLQILYDSRHPNADFRCGCCSAPANVNNPATDDSSVDSWDIRINWFGPMATWQDDILNICCNCAVVLFHLLEWIWCKFTFVPCLAGMRCCYWRFIRTCDWHDGGAAERFHIISCRYTGSVQQGLCMLSLSSWIYTASQKSKTSDSCLYLRYVLTDFRNYLFHRFTKQDFCNKIIITDLTTPQKCWHPTLSNISFFFKLHPTAEFWKTWVF